MFKSSLIGTVGVFFLTMVYPLSVQADTWKVERLAYDLETAEGPVWDANGKLYFTEIFANRIHEYTVETGAYRIIRRESGGANGMAFDSQKRLLMCEMLGRRVSRRELDGTIVSLWQAEDSGKGGPNDITVSSNGNGYFTMPSHKTVYRIAQEGSVTALIKNIPGINGVILSRDERILYVTEYRKRRIHIFPLDDTEYGFSINKVSKWASFPSRTKKSPIVPFKGTTTTSSSSPLNRDCSSPIVTQSNRDTIRFQMKFTGQGW